MKMKKIYLTYQFLLFSASDSEFTWNQVMTVMRKNDPLMHIGLSEIFTIHVSKM